MVVAVFLTLASTACGTKATEINRMKFSNDNSTDQRRTVASTPKDISPKAELPTLDASKIPTVTYCELIKNAADYDRKIVRVRGVYFNGFERMFFYDEHCVKNEPPTAGKDIPAETWIQWDADYSRKDDSDDAKQYRAVKSGRANGRNGHRQILRYARHQQHGQRKISASRVACRKSVGSRRLGIGQWS